MDKNVLKKFAIESRQELMDKISNKIKKFYVDEEFKVNQNGEVCVLSNEKHTLSLTKKEYENRQLLIKRINEITLEQVIEEAAYTWFNRIIAIRYMEIHDYLPLTKDNQSLGIRVLSSKDNTPDPEIMKISNLINPELDIEFNKEYYSTIQDNNKRFEYILLLVCKKLGKVIPQVFDGITDYIDILIPDNLLNESGYITKLLKDVHEDNYEQVEIIGWLYQYYNQAEKERVMSEKRAYKKEEVPFVTQLFTPDWIVKYMVDNSLGRYIISNISLIEKLSCCEFLIDDITKEKTQLNINDIKFIDPCCGSGHVLVYAFEVLYNTYLQLGYNKNDIAYNILKNNLYGLDIDERAKQLTILSLILKAMEYDKNILKKELVKGLNIFSTLDSGNISSYLINSIESERAKEELNRIIKEFCNVSEIGSLLKLEKYDYNCLEEYIKNEETLIGIELRDNVLPLINLHKIFTAKYDVLVTNPPYLAYSNMSSVLKNYLDINYPNSKKDLCTAFMENDLVKEHGIYGMINQHSWMFINTYEKLRKYIIDNFSILNMIHLGTRAFEEIGGEVVQTTSFIFQKSKTNLTTKFIRLVDFGESESKRINCLKSIKENNFYNVNCKIFNDIPGYTFDYWINNEKLILFKNKKIRDYANVITGMTTGNNNKFLKLWYEIDFNKIEFNNNSVNDINLNKKYYYPYSKGGERIKWYGGYDYVVNWSLSNQFNRAKTTLKNLYFKKAITWPFISSGSFSAKILKNGFLWDVAGSPCFVNEDKYYNYILAFLNTPIANDLLDMINPTINVQAVDIETLPLIINENYIETINNLVENNIQNAKKIWNENELSWDFNSHFFMTGYKNIKESLENYHQYIKQLSYDIYMNEIKLNEIFYEIYNIKEKNEINKFNDSFDEVLEIKKFISFFVGCLFGRYPLNNNFEKDMDYIIPIIDNNYFADDIVYKFVEFLKCIYGNETVYENLEFIAEKLGKKNGENSEDTIRRYFINDFFNDHIKMYQKRPIYWLFDSGKKNGFKCLIYMHRYNKGTVSKVRLDYLHKMQNTYEKELYEINQKLSKELSLQDKKELTKKQADLNAKLQETKEYDEKIAHIADKTIEIDLDDGVAVNYAKFSVKNPKTGKEESILANSKDIAIKKKKED